MEKYDFKVLQKAVDRLYDEARGIVYIYSIIGALLGVGVALLLENTILKTRSTVLVSSFVVFVCGYVAYGMGKRRSWALRFEAQQLRLQMQIEENTRNAGATSVLGGAVTPAAPPQGRIHWVWAVGLALLVVAVVIMFIEDRSGQLLRSTESSGQPPPSVSKPPVRKMVEETHMLTAYDQIFLAAGESRGIEIDVGPSQFEAVVEFTFKVPSGENSGVRVALFRKRDFDHYWTRPRLWETNGPVSSGTCFRYLPQDQYLLIFSNEHDRTGPKTIQLRNSRLRFKRPVEM